MRNYQIYYVVNKNIVFEFEAGSDEQALIKARDWLRSAGRVPQHYLLRELRVGHGTLTS